MLNRLMGERDISTQNLFELARTDRSMGFKIMKGERLPSRDVLIRVALILHLEVEQAQALLKAGHRAQLTPRDDRDAILLSCLIRRLSLADADELLEEAGEEAL